MKTNNGSKGSTTGDKSLPNSKKSYVAGELHPDLRIPLFVIPSAAENTPCGDAGGWTASPVWETGARLGKARIKSLTISCII